MWDFSLIEFSKCCAVDHCPLVTDKNFVTFVGLKQVANCTHPILILHLNALLIFIYF